MHSCQLPFLQKLTKQDSDWAHACTSHLRAPGYEPVLKRIRPLDSIPCKVCTAADILLDGKFSPPKIQEASIVILYELAGADPVDGIGRELHPSRAAKFVETEALVMKEASVIRKIEIVESMMNSMCGKVTVINRNHMQEEFRIPID